MMHLALDNGLMFDKDVKMVSLGSSSDFKDYIDQNQNRTLFGVLFCTTEWSTKVDVSNTTFGKYTEQKQMGFDVP